MTASYGRTGADIMVHGDCKSAGCYAMTDGVIEEIYILAREALAGGQPAFQVQAYPFRMTAANMAKHKSDKWYGFWRNLKEGYDYFEVTHLPPKVDVCDKHYLINAVLRRSRGAARSDSACPAYQRLPVQALPRGPVLQQASTKPGTRQSEAKPSRRRCETPSQAASIAKPLGSCSGLAFRPAEAARLSGLHARPGDAGDASAAPTKPVKAQGHGDDHGRRVITATRSPLYSRMMGPCCGKLLCFSSSWRSSAAGLVLFSAREQAAARPRFDQRSRGRRITALQRSGCRCPARPISPSSMRGFGARACKLGAPVFMRIFKLESELELWMEKDGRYQLFATYPICLWSGRLGPKLAEGDLQAPEGFYTVGQGAAQSEQPLAPLLQSRLSQRIRPGARAHRLLHHDPWRLPVDRLLRHDQSRHRRAVADRDGGARSEASRACPCMSSRSA